MFNGRDLSCGWLAWFQALNSLLKDFLKLQWRKSMGNLLKEPEPESESGRSLLNSISLVNSDPSFTSCLTLMNVHWPWATIWRVGVNQDRFPPS